MATAREERLGARRREALSGGPLVVQATFAVAGDSAMTEAREQASPVESAPAALSQTHAVLQVLLIVVGAAVSVWALHRLAAVALVLILAALFAHVIAPSNWPSADSDRRPAASCVASGRHRRPCMCSSPAARRRVPRCCGPARPRRSTRYRARPGVCAVDPRVEHGWSRYYERLRIPIELRKRIDESVLAADDAAIAYRAWIADGAGREAVVCALAPAHPDPRVFLLKDATSVRRTIVKALPHHGRLRGHRLFEELHATLVAYIRAQLLACVLVGTICGVGFAALGIPYAVLLGVLAAVLEFIPLVGPLLLATVAAIVGALHAPILALWAVGFLRVVRLIEDYVIYPRLIRRGMHLHPLAVIVAILDRRQSWMASRACSSPCLPPRPWDRSRLHRHWLEWRGRDDAGRLRLLCTRRWLSGAA